MSWISSTCSEIEIEKWGTYNFIVIVELLSVNLVFEYGTLHFGSYFSNNLLQSYSQESTLDFGDFDIFVQERNS